MLRILAAALCLTAASAATAVRATAADCRLQLLADLKVRVFEDMVLAPVVVDGKQVNMQLDLETGPSTIIYEAIDRMGLTQLRNSPHNSLAFLDSVRIGNIELRDFQIVVSRLTMWAVRPQWHDLFDAGLDGTISGATLSRFDVELDLAHDRVRLFAPGACSAALPYWSGPSVSMPFERDMRYYRSGSEDHDILLPARIGGVAAEAYLTDSEPNTVALEWARHFGIGQDAAGMTMLPSGHSYDMKRFPNYGAVLPRLTLGGATLTNVPVMVASEWRTSWPRMMLGTDFLQHNRVYIAYHDHMVYFTPYALMPKS